MKTEILNTIIRFSEESKNDADAVYYPNFKKLTEELDALFAKRIVSIEFKEIHKMTYIELRQERKELISRLELIDSEMKKECAKILFKTGASVKYQP